MDSAYAARYSPSRASLTTMAMPLREFGESAARLLEEQLASAGEHSPAQLAFSAELVVRESSLRTARSV